MKKSIFILMAAILIAALMVGCVPQQNTDLSVLQKQLDGIASEISDLRSDLDKLETPQEQNSSDAPASSSASDSIVSAPSGTPAQDPLSDYNLVSLANEVDILVEKTENATTEKMFDVKAEIDALDRRIGDAEDSAEHDYKQGLLSREDYRSVDAETERLEEALDLAEDKMEIRLGYYD